MYKSIVVSCDTYYYVLGNDLGIDNISTFMRRLGLGSRTGASTGLNVLSECSSSRIWPSCTLYARMKRPPHGLSATMGRTGGIVASATNASLKPRSSPTRRGRSSVVGGLALRDGRLFHDRVVSVA